MAAAGVDLAASAAALVSISFKTVKFCFEIFDLIEKVQNLPQDAELVRWKLVYEHYRLHRWYKQVWLEDETRPSTHLNWQLIKLLLEQFRVLLEKSQTVRERLMITGDGTTRQASKERAPTGIRRVLSRLVPDFAIPSTPSSDGANDASTWTRVRWAFTDKERVDQFLKEIKHLNDCLVELLENAEQEFNRNALRSLLREVISRTSSQTELEIVKQLLKPTIPTTSEALSSAATVKQIRLLLSLDNTPDERKAGPLATRRPPNLQLEVKQLLQKSLIRECSDSKTGRRELARYKSQMVLVEWKYMQPELEQKLKRTVESLAVMLSNVADPSFHTLQALGFIRYQDPIRYAYVFRLPTIVPPSPDLKSNTGYVLHTLEELYTSDLRKPSLDERSRIALYLAETVLQIHTAGWIHKGIRSDNVLFCDKDERNWRRSSSFGPYLTGYEYARVEGESTLTEKTPSSPELDLYLHPSLHSAVRPAYTKVFDLFSLGCVFLELALWKPLSSILTEYSEIERLKSLSLNTSSISVSAHETGMDSKTKLPDTSSTDASTDALIDSTSEPESSDLFWTPSDPVIYSSAPRNPTSSSIASTIVAPTQSGSMDVPGALDFDVYMSDSLMDEVAFHAGKTFREIALLCFTADETNPDAFFSITVQKDIVERLKKCSY